MNEIIYKWYHNGTHLSVNTFSLWMVQLKRSARATRWIALNPHVVCNYCVRFLLLASFFLGLPILFLCCEMCNFLARRYTNAGRRGNPMQLIFVGWEVLLRTALFCAHICTWSPFFKAMTIEQSTCCGAEKTLMRIKKAVLCKRWKLIFCWLSKRKKIL